MRLHFLLVSALIAFCAFAQDDYKYVSLEDFPVGGKATQFTSNRYARLPDSLKGKVRDELWSLGQNSAGVTIRFRSNTSNVKMKWKSINQFGMNHMTPAGIRGLDLYAMQPDSTWTFVGSARPTLGKHHNYSTVISNMEPEMREYMLYLSLYDGVDSIFVGVDSLAEVIMPEVNLPIKEKPIVMYGTSILQGGCANRPGMAHTNILQRDLNREVINLGFSGNAKLDAEIAELMASVDASLYVIDALPNVTLEQLKERIGPFYSLLRSKRPTTPILLVENPQFPDTRFDKKKKSEIELENEALKSWFDAQSDDNLYYFLSPDILKGNVEATVDNSHFTDLGFSIYASALRPVIEEIISR